MMPHITDIWDALYLFLLCGAAAIAGALLLVIAVFVPGYFVWRWINRRRDRYYRDYCLRRAETMMEALHTGKLVEGPRPHRTSFHRHDQ